MYVCKLCMYVCLKNDNIYICVIKVTQLIRFLKEINYRNCKTLASCKHWLPDKRDSRPTCSCATQHRPEIWYESLSQLYLPNHPPTARPTHPPGKQTPPPRSPQPPPPPGGGTSAHTICVGVVCAVVAAWRLVFVQVMRARALLGEILSFDITLLHTHTERVCRPAF